MAFPINQEIVVYDDNYCYQKVRYKEVGRRFQNIVNQYSKILHEIVDAKCIEGQAAASLKNFAELFQTNFNETIAAVFEYQSKEMPGFVREIDSADKKLY